MSTYTAELEGKSRSDDTGERTYNSDPGVNTQFETKASVNVDVQSLQEELKNSIEGEVRFDDGSRALYATDASNYRQLPIGVVLPKSEQDVIQTMTICRKYNAPVLSRGGGTSLAGQCCNVAVVMDMSKYYNHILNIDETNKLVTVEPGIVLDVMRQNTEKAVGLTFGPDPATHNHCTLGGMLGNNSCGVHSVMAQHYGYGARTSDNTERLTVLTYDGLVIDTGPTSDEELEHIIAKGGRKGEIYSKLRDLRDKYGDLIRERFPKIPRRVSGYNLDELLPENGFNVARALVGTESTCVTILNATLKLLPKPEKRALLVLGYPDVYEAGKNAPEVMKHKPIGLEGIDNKLIGYMKNRGLNVKDISLLPPGKGWLMVEFGGDTQQEADNKARKLMDELKQKEDAPSMCLFDNNHQEAKLWEVRESGLGATAFVPNKDDTWPGWEDSAISPEKVGDYLRDLRKLFEKYNYEASLYGHFGQGCIHCRINFELVTAEGIQTYKNFTTEAAHLVVDYGGSLSGEHGDGQARADLLEIMYGKELLQAFREFKEIWDPEWKMNPGKVVNPYHRDENLRIGVDYQPANPETYFKFPVAGGFSRAVLHCVGVGLCRRHEGGTMCPSYMVTREEKHSTRGRSRLLFEMLQGDVITDGFQSEAVKESLDLCLACKGCKGDCPVHVDMATYKAEFLSHYYEKKLRPRSAYAFGWIYWWSRLASLLPGFVNFLTQTPVSARLMKLAAGIAPERKIPKFAPQTFRHWFRNRKKPSLKPNSKVILWVDTFNNFFLPETLVAATEVLETAGFEVIIPKQMLCCGRPLYDFGMLKTAKRLLNDIMNALRDEIRSGTPIVGLEPSCVSVFRDELGNLFPHDADAKRLQKQTFTLAEFLEKEAPAFNYPQLKHKAVVHGHCHHKSVLKMDAEDAVLKKTGLDYQVLDSGCCGMAGYFGYEAGEHYRVGLAAGERVLLPSVREASPDTIIIADGFSCREMIEQETNRKGMHLAQVLQMAAHEQRMPHNALYPEKRYVDNLKLNGGSARIKRIAFITGMAALTLVFFAINHLKENSYEI